MTEPEHPSVILRLPATATRREYFATWPTGAPLPCVGDEVVAEFADAHGSLGQDLAYRVTRRLLRPFVSHGDGHLVVSVELDVERA
jgi:hypothetical protein